MLIFASWFRMLPSTAAACPQKLQSVFLPSRQSLSFTPLTNLRKTVFFVFSFQAYR
jgi:hypothetical protein